MTNMQRKVCITLRIGCSASHVFIALLVIADTLEYSVCVCVCV